MIHKEARAEVHEVLTNRQLCYAKYFELHAPFLNICKANQR